MIQLINSLKGKNPDMVMQNMLKSNPEFSKFIQENKGKSPEQIASNYGIDFLSLKQALAMLGVKL